MIHKSQKEKTMSSKPYAINVTCDSELELTPEETASLKEAFKTGVVQVFSATTRDDLPPFPEININSGRGSSSASTSQQPEKSPSKGEKKY
jgi:hypothetical protein